MIYSYDPSEITSTSELKFPEQSLKAEELLFLPVISTDPCFKRKESLEVVQDVKTEYLIFLDDGDTFQKDFLEILRNSFQKQKTSFAYAVCSFDTDMIVEPMTVEEIQGNESINLELSQIRFPTDLHGVLFRTKDLQRALQTCTGSIEIEKAVLLYLLEKNPVFTYVSKAVLTYKYPKDQDYLFYPGSLKREWYYDPLERFLLPLLEVEKKNTGGISRFHQIFALAMLLFRIKANFDNRDKHVLSKEEALAYTKLCSKVLQYVDYAAILTVKSDMTKMELKDKLLMVRLKKDDFDYYPDLTGEDRSLRMMVEGICLGSFKSLNVQLQLLDFQDGYLEIDGNIPFFIRAEEMQLFAEFEKKRYPVQWNGRYSLFKCFGVTYYRKRSFHVSIPVEEKKKDRKLMFILRIHGMDYPVEYNYVAQFSRFALKYSYGSWPMGKMLGVCKKDGLHVIMPRKWQIVYKELRLWLQMYRADDGAARDQIRYRVLSFLLKPWFSKHKICLYMDKIYKGGDSSEYLYRYAMKQKDGIRKYYLLDKESSDYARMKKEGYKPLIRGSLKHRLIFLNSDMIVASNSTVCAFNDYDAAASLPIRGMLHFGVACVQHGMSVQNIAIAQNRLRDNTKLYFCASPYEITNLSKPVYDYVGYDALKLTGVPRYDGLKNRAEKILLISPTWRMQSALPVTKNEGVARDYNPNFKETSYYRVYNGLINDPKLLEAAKKYGYRIQYVLHPIVSPQVDDFEKNDYVEIIPAIGDMSYEKLFCEAALMVTDFSGVQFDFAYMRKPVVYLHHKDIPKHYEEGIFHYDTMGFGEICESNEELIGVLCRYMEKNCEMPEKYRKRADDFFQYSDHKNCERIYPILRDYILQH